MDRAGATTRYRETLDNLRAEFVAEHGREYGWKSFAARRLGVSPSYISKLVARPELLVARHAVSAAANGEATTRTLGADEAAIAALRDIDADTWARVRAWADVYHGQNS